MIQRHWDHHTIKLTEAQALADHIAVVENIVMTQRRALGKASGARGVLDVDRVIELQSSLALGQHFWRYRGTTSEEVRPRQQAYRRSIGQTNHPAQFSQLGTSQLTLGANSQLRHQLHDHLVIITALKGTSTNQPAAAGLA
ncbi:hypothetical protein D3C84_810640 [compost metagenome]